MRIGVVGAGVTGLTAAYELGKQGHEVIVYEAEAVAGGLSSGFRVPGWEWTLDRFYRHMFAGDKEIIALARELRTPLTFRAPTTSVWVNGHPYAYDSAIGAAFYPRLPLYLNLRVGMVIAYLKYLLRDGTRLEQTTADAWLRRAMGKRAYQELWEPMLRGKFKTYYDRVNMAWFWARIAARTPRLGYFDGGFQVLIDRLAESVREQGGQVRLATPVSQIGRVEGRIALILPRGEGATFDRMLTTTSPYRLGQMLRYPGSELPEDAIRDLVSLKSTGAVVLILALDHSVLTDGTYWLNLPAGEFPCLSMVEHTNYQDKAHYGGSVIVYLGDYLPVDAPEMHMSTQELYAAYRPALIKVQPQFEDGWVQGMWSFREPYAQPVPEVGHSLRVPAVDMPIIPNLYWACMHHVYPWDRGTNFAVEVGKHAARVIGGSSAG
jgi:protoporphyrinogen oxidase